MNAPSPRDDGTLRIAVTGHRDIASPDGVAANVDRALDDLLAVRVDGTVVEVLSSLAEGADRLVTERVLARPGGRLVAVLPLDAANYRRDFLTPASVEHFDRLLEDASDIEVMGADHTGTRESAYERAGHRVVDGCDALIALWDGKPSRGRGGTAEIIDYARSHGCVVLIIPVRRDELRTTEDQR